MGGVMKFGVTSSTNQLNFGFPYGGPQTGTLTVRTHPRYGKSAIVSVERGQIDCGYPTCSVMVRFDDGKAERYSMLKPDDHSSTSLFFQSTARFVEKLRKASRVRIEVTFYNQGAHTLDFAIQGFDASKVGMGKPAKK